MFVHLPMDAPLQGDTVGHAGTDPIHPPSNPSAMQPSSIYSVDEYLAANHPARLSIGEAFADGMQQGVVGNVARLAI